MSLTILEVLEGAQMNFDNAEKFAPMINANFMYGLAKNQLDNALTLIIKHDKGLDDDFDESLLEAK